MAALVLQVPHATARVLSGINLSEWGEPEPRDSYHITLLNFGDALPVSEVARALPVIYSVTSKFEPFSVRTNRVSTFPPHPEHGTVPIICPIESVRLDDLHSALCRACDSANIEYSKEFDVFRPHVTLGYADDPGVSGAINQKFQAVEWGAHELTMWAGDEGDGRLFVTFPLPLMNVSKMAYKVARRHATQEMQNGK